MIGKELCTIYVDQLQIECYWIVAMHHLLIILLMFDGIQQLKLIYKGRSYLVRFVQFGKGHSKNNRWLLE